MRFPEIVALQARDNWGRLYSMRSIPSFSALVFLGAIAGLGAFTNAVVMTDLSRLERGQNAAIARVAQEYPPLAAIWLRGAPR